MNDSVQELQRGPLRSLASHPAVSVALGTVFVAAIATVLGWDQWPAALPRLEGLSSLQLALFGGTFVIMLLVGATTAVVGVLSRRLPLLATTAAVLLGYGLLATRPDLVPVHLPYPASWQGARLHAYALLTGMMAATAVWGFLPPRRSQPVPAADAGPGSPSNDERSGHNVPRWGRHLAAGVAGIVLALAVQAFSVQVFRRPEFNLPQEAPEWRGLMVGTLLLIGAVVAVVVLISPRVPWLSTALGVALVYGTLGTLPPAGFDLGLPSYPPLFQTTFWLPTVTIAAVVIGASIVGAVWGWRTRLVIPTRSEEPASRDSRQQNR